MIIDTRETKSAVYLIDERFPRTPKHPVPSGWDKDNRGAKDPFEKLWGRGGKLETSDEGKYPLIMSRRFMPVREGKASFHHIVEMISGDGFFLEFFNIEEKSVLCLTQKDGILCCGNTKLGAFNEKKSYAIGIEFDLDENSALITLDGKACATLPLKADNLARLKTGYKAGSTGSCVVVRTILTINYAVCDKDYVHTDTDMPYTWDVLCDEGCSAGIKYYSEGQGFFTYRLDAKSGKAAKVFRPFKAQCGKVLFELKYLTVKDSGESVKIAITSGEKEALTLYDNGTKLYSNTVCSLRKHHPYVWQTLRVEADTNEGKAVVKLNGKKCGEVDFDVKTDSLDGLSISYCPDYDGYMRFADVIVYEIQPEPEDYPKPPVMPQRKPDYYTGMNICSLWRTGSHWGWDPISNFHDNQTYLGTYDEGITEVADWEIKWMAEHGLDCEFYCWYANQKTAPMFDTHLCDALHDGHFHAKYGDKVKFAIIWEAMNCVHPESVEQFKKYYIPLWIDYYFSDERYFAIDGVAILAVFGVQNLIKDFGSEENVHECFEALREAVKKIGYRDLCVMANVAPSQSSYKAGINASYTYNWGFNSYSSEFNINCNKGRMIRKESEQVHVVPTLAVGYNDVAWRVDRHPMMTCEEMGETLKWMTDKALPSYKDKDEEWKRKFFMLATWNEYGEGTYICPANLNGFGYLNELRKAVTVNGDSYESERPSKEVLDRLGYLHPKGRTLLYTPQLVQPDGPEKVVGEMKIQSQADVEKWRTDNLNIRFENGMMKGDATAFDPKMEIDVDIDTSEIAGFEVKLRSVEGGNDASKANPLHSPFIVFFSTENSPEYSESKKLAKMADGRNGAAIMLGSTVPEWKGKVTRIRIDPTDNVGAFEFEYIKLLAWDKTPIVTFVDGKEYNSHYPSKVEDGKAYVLFEAQRDFHLLTNLYYEWDNDERTLMIECDGKISYWKENSDVVKFDGKEIKLNKPLEFYDNLPYMPLDEFCLVTGYKYTVNDSRFDIITK